MIGFIKQGIMLMAVFLRRADDITVRIRCGEARPLRDEPDWCVGTIVRAFRASHTPDARRLHALACAEWAERMQLRHDQAAEKAPT